MNGIHNLTYTTRGEHPSVLCFGGSSHGSSPLARGTPHQLGVGLTIRRFIPARVGNTIPSSIPTKLSSVHPRSRGEHRQNKAIVLATFGSSPLARGTLTHRNHEATRPRFIPARAGNTTARWDGPGASTVHPRSRGEHSPSIRLYVSSYGSSPLARGTRLHLPAGQLLCRFIPARAGSTVTMVAVFSLRYGSSPLARGTRRGRRESLQLRRFIPARAGNTRSRCPGARRATVHPRSRGEHVEIPGGVPR